MCSCRHAALQGQTLLREISALQSRLDQERTQRSFVQSAVKDSKDEVSIKLQQQAGRHTILCRTSCPAAVASCCFVPAARSIRHARSSPPMRLPMSCRTVLSRLQAQELAALRKRLATLETPWLLRMLGSMSQMVWGPCGGTSPAAGRGCDVSTCQCLQSPLRILGSPASIRGRSV